MADFTLGGGIEVSINPPEPTSIVVDPPTSTAVLVVPVAGAKGDPGPAGTRYEFVQASPAATWTIVHNLGAYPDFLFFLDEAPTVPVWTDVTYPDANTAVVTWPTPESGRAES